MYVSMQPFNSAQGSYDRPIGSLLDPPWPGSAINISFLTLIISFSSSPFCRNTTNDIFRNVYPKINMNDALVNFPCPVYHEFSRAFLFFNGSVWECLKFGAPRISRKSSCLWLLFKWDNCAGLLPTSGTKEDEPCV